MRTRMMCLVLVGCALLPLAGCTKPSQKSKDSRDHGTIKVIDAQARTLVLSEKQPSPTAVDKVKIERTFQVAPDCEIATLGKGLSDLSDLKVGDHVTIKYTKVGNSFVAHKIYPHGPQPTPPPPESTR